MRIHVGVKRWQGEPAELHRIAVAVLLDDDVGARFLVFQLDLVAHQLDRFALSRVRRARRNDEEPHFGAFLASNLLDHLVESHIANIDEILGALSDGANPITNF
jgi:hypothetical protein